MSLLMFIVVLRIRLINLMLKGDLCASDYYASEEGQKPKNEKRFLK